MQQIRYGAPTLRTIAHISDLHFGALDAEVAEALVPYLRGIDPDLLIVSGDLTQRARAEQFDEAIGYIERLRGEKTKLLIVPGNHDVPLYAVWERFIRPLGRYARRVRAATEYVDEGLRVLGVSTPRAFVEVWDGFWKDGRVSAGQLAPLRGWGESAPGELRVLVTHHPFCPAPGTRRGGVILHGRRAGRLIAQAGVDVLLAGHLHAGYHQQLTFNAPDGSERRVLSVQAGTATSSRRRHGPDGSEYSNSFNVLKFSRQPLRGAETDVLTLEVHSASRSGSVRWQRERRSRFARYLQGFELLPEDVAEGESGR